MKHCLVLPALALLLLHVPAVAAAPGQPVPTLAAVQHRAFDFFWRESDPATGLTKDRATNLGDTPDTHTVASIASTGYALAALPIGVERGWVSNKGAYARALATLDFVHDRLPQVHGFYYHFVDWRTGERAWKSELSSIDSALLAMGALAAGQYWPGTPVQRLADDVAARMDWQWMGTDGGATPGALEPSMGWHPDTGFLAARWQGYNESAFLHVLALGTPGHGLPPAAWADWTFPEATEEGYKVFGGPSPIFWAQMTPGFLDLRGVRDPQGRDWWAAWKNAHLADQAYCARHPGNKTYAAGFWGINASDQPTGYGADAPEDGHNTGTVTPTAMLAGVLFTPAAARKSLTDLWTLRDKIWGRYGFSDAFNVDKGWYDKDVIGIDLGMMLLATENARTGLVWKLVGASPIIRAGLAPIGLQKTSRR